jgi:ABC-type proline/glycine betaine transport system permease subunit
LLFALGALVFAGLIGHVFNLGFIGPWPMIVLAVLAVFLLLQVLPLLVSKKPREQPPSN